jgi:hypothetical protein
MGGGVAQVYKRACDQVKTFSPTYHMTRSCSKLASFLASTSKGITLGQKNSTKLKTCYYHHHQPAFSNLETT